MTLLSSYLRTAAENAHDGAIPAATLSFINQVAAAEREMARDAGAVETAKRSLDAAYEEYRDAYAALCQMQRMAARHPGDGLIGEEVQRARADCINSLEWLEASRLKMSVALRQAAEDARQAGGAAQGAAA